MSIPRFVNGNIPNEVDTNAVKLDPNVTSSRIKQSHNPTILDQEQSRVDDANHCSTSPVCAVPMIRQFWKAGLGNHELIPNSTTQYGSSYLNIHPRFLHSNATSHKWVFGAVAELIDNVVDEIQYGATIVIIDRISNPRNGSPALLIQDDGSGMDPEAMRRCLSFGFSDKTSISSIGKYGNGFKTSSMRLGADVMVFSRNQTNRRTTQSVGLLSYTFLTRMGYNRVVVPMVHYEFNTVTKSFDFIRSESDEKNSNLNLSMMLQWSPYSTEKELLEQFEDLGPQGTKIILYNLWLNDDGNMELDFESDPEDIRITRDAPVEMKDKSLLAESQQHIANRHRYSLRAYLSILYLNLPKTFAMVLRGKVVLYHNIATDLKHTEFILYKPHCMSVEVSVITTIGFLKEAPNINVHGFNIYHKNRLILPFWPVVSFKGRGVVGILEANFIEPTHNKQDFEQTSLFQKLVIRLKQMTYEYWNHHCGLVGYESKRKDRPPSAATSFPHHHGTEPPALSRKSSADGFASNAPKITTITSRAEFLSYTKLIEPSFPTGVQEEASNLKRKASDQLPTFESNAEMEVDPKKGSDMPDLIYTEEDIYVMKENKRLRSKCNEYEKAHEQLTLRVIHLKVELFDAEAEYARILAEVGYLEKVQGGNTC